MAVRLVSYKLREEKPLQVQSFMDFRIADEGLWVHSEDSDISKGESVTAEPAGAIAYLLVRAQLLQPDFGGSRGRT